MLLFSFPFVVITAQQQRTSQPRSLPTWAALQRGPAAPTAAPRQLHRPVRVISQGQLKPSASLTSRV